MTNTDPSGLIGAGIIGIVVGLVIYAGVLALTLWVFWAIIRSAVRRALWDHSSGIGRPKR
jgi:hypothetical protein